MKAEVLKKLQGAVFFRGLNEAQLEQICNKSRILSFDKEDIIFYQGNEANAFFLVLSGWVSIIKENKNAEQSILHVFKEGDSFAEPAAMVIKKYPASAYAATACELLEVNVKALKQMVQEDPDIAMRLIARLSIQLNTLVNEFEQYKTLSVSKRLAIFLLQLTDSKEGCCHIVLPFNKTVLAAHLGVQPGSLSRAFNQLTKRGVRSERGKDIEIENISVLQDYIHSA